MNIKFCNQPPHERVKFFMKCVKLSRETGHESLTSFQGLITNFVTNTRVFTLYVPLNRRSNGESQSRENQTLRQEARKRRIISNVKPFIGTLRVTNPVRQSRASSRKPVLRGERRFSLRSVDSEIKRCAIEPRDFPFLF